MNGRVLIYAWAVVKKGDLSNVLKRELEYRIFPSGVAAIAAARTIDVCEPPPEELRVARVVIIEVPPGKRFEGVVFKSTTKKRRR